MRSKRSLSLLLVVALLPGCGPYGPPKQDAGLIIGGVAGGILGSQVGRGAGRAVATIAGAVVGGIVGSEIGRALDQQDRMLAQEAEFAAFEHGRSGERRPWRNPDSGRYGEVIPGAAYRRGYQDCRDYTHTIYIDGRPQTMRGSACRNPDGTWRHVG
jgi:surface antigen